ncbi:MAG: bifunctional homocysteine S-methyltransferase/methylenetetrahydrofolate reductase [Actinobacteria bacterium]|nr:MAG: bifunctional homocysteine S-methyltransferase/methylenetetrahydrofolate reductase [Actinomycetota bacterium]
MSSEEEKRVSHRDRRMSRALERLERGPVIVADGGTGALIASMVSRLRCPEEANLKAPEAVISVHLGFIRAGAGLIETNTFGANRRKLSAQLLDDRLEEIVQGGVKLAREAREVSGADVLVAGAIGPLGDFDGGAAADDAYEIFVEQAQLLEARGVDLFMVETFFELGELEQAIAAVRAVSALPVVAQLTFDEDAQTLAGVGAAEAIERLRGLEVAAVGANCGLGPQATLSALSEMAQHADGIALTAQPNVGLPSRSGGRLVYPNATPDYFAEFAAQARSLGARIIGGCCGTTPSQIAAIKAAVDAEREPRLQLFVAERELGTRAVVAGETPGELARRLAEGEWVVSVELDPPKGSNTDAMLRTAARLRDSGLVHATDLNDNPMARARLSALMAAVAIERIVGLETIPHVTPRDASVMGLQSQLLGAHSDGIRNVLAVTGDPPHVGDYPGSSGVYEVDSIGLVSILARLNEGEDFAGKAIDAPTSFYIGVAVNPSADDLTVEIERFRRKVEAGARFAMTQALFDLGYLDRFLDELGGETPVPLLVGIWPLRSFGLAFRIHNEVPGIVVPEEVQRRLADAGPEAAEVGAELARELVHEARSRAAGVYIIPPFKEPEAALELLAGLD